MLVLRMCALNALFSPPVADAWPTTPHWVPVAGFEDEIDRGIDRR